VVLSFNRRGLPDATAATAFKEDENIEGDRDLRLEDIGGFRKGLLRQGDAREFKSVWGVGYGGIS